MRDPRRLLELIEEGLVAHGGDLGGWTRHDDDSLQIFDGRVTLRAQLPESDSPSPDGLVHAHVLATLHECDDEVLDACLFGIGDDDDQALQQTAVIWMTCVAGPIRSFLDNRPVCMTCQTGVAGGNMAEGYAADDFGMPGLRAYVGPSIGRALENINFEQVFGAEQPWFRFAASSAAPRRVHIAKATIESRGKNGWRRQLEVDGHDISYSDPNWPARELGPEFGYVTRFAVFEFPRNSKEITRRAELERTLWRFATQFQHHASVGELCDAMLNDGFDPELVHDISNLSTLAFGRVFFEAHGVDYSPTVIVARRDGTIAPDVPLMSLPAYTRARAMAPRLNATLSPEAYQNLCLYSAESNAILQMLEAEGNLSDARVLPCVVPELGATEATVDRALELLQARIKELPPAAPAPRKPWWRFW